MKLILITILIRSQIVSYLLDLPEKDEEEEERAQINNFDTLWGETGRTPPDNLYSVFSCKYECTFCSLKSLSLNLSSDSSSGSGEAGRVSSFTGAGCRCGSAQPQGHRATLQRRAAGTLAGEHLQHLTSRLYFAHMVFVLV